MNSLKPVNYFFPFSQHVPIRYCLFCWFVFCFPTISVTLNTESPILPVKEWISFSILDSHNHWAVNRGYCCLSHLHRTSYSRTRDTQTCCRALGNPYSNTRPSPCEEKLKSTAQTPRYFALVNCIMIHCINYEVFNHQTWPTLSSWNNEKDTIQIERSLLY